MLSGWPVAMPNLAPRGIAVGRRRSKSDTDGAAPQQLEPGPLGLWPHGHQWAAGDRAAAMVPNMASTATRSMSCASLLAAGQLPLQQPSGQPQQLLRSQARLTPAQVRTLRAVLHETFEVHGSRCATGSGHRWPTLYVRLRELVNAIRQRLVAAGLPARGVKLNGGAASHILAAGEFPFSDVDLIFHVPLSTTADFDKVRDIVLDALHAFVPANVSSAVDRNTLREAYMRKMVKVCSGADRWSLFCVNNDSGRCVELKFVDRCRRGFEFSVDSFQLTLDRLLDEQQGGAADAGDRCPLVLAESMYGDFKTAVRHLDERLIDTRRPEEIRGGGLLKYCALLTRGYRPAKPWKCRQLERYMCSRFFIDFPDVRTQEAKLLGYLYGHLNPAGAVSAATQQAAAAPGVGLEGAKSRPVTPAQRSASDGSSIMSDDSESTAATSSSASSLAAPTAGYGAQYEYLMLLHRIVSESTVCLMTHERRQTLSMIERLAYQVQMNHIYLQQQLQHQQQHAQITNNMHQTATHQHHRQQVGQAGKVPTRRHQERPPPAVTPTVSECSCDRHQNQNQNHGTNVAPRQMLMYLPRNANYWIPVV